MTHSEAPERAAGPPARQPEPAAAAPTARYTESEELEGRPSGTSSANGLEHDGLIGELASAVELSQMNGWPGHNGDVDDWEKVDFGEFEVTLFKQHVRELVKRQVNRQRTPQRTLLRDKIAFVLGTMGAMLSAYWLGASPETFYRLYTGAAVVLFLLRWLTYRTKGAHYYLLDLCYACNLLMLVHLWVFPHSAFLHKVTSLFLHWYPACVAWTERWHPQVQGRESGRRTAAAMREWEEASLTDLVLLPLLPYLAWALVYYAKVFVISREKIQQRGYETLFKYMTVNNARTTIGRSVLSVPKRWQPLVYMAWHMGLTTMTLVLTRLLWSFQGAHTLFLLFVLSVSAWNGACFYFEYFAKRYVSSLQSKKPE